MIKTRTESRAFNLLIMLFFLTFGLVVFSSFSVGNNSAHAFTKEQILKYKLNENEASARKKIGNCEIRPGDLIFHRSGSDQAGAIEYLTKSPLTHVGVVFNIQGNWYVYEAISKVTATPIDNWIARGQGRKFSISRYQDGLNTNLVKALFEAGKPFWGKEYDVLFKDDEKYIYCSELAIKMYQRMDVYWINFVWSSQFDGMWKVVSALDGWPEFEKNMSSGKLNDRDLLVKKIMSARGIDSVSSFASQRLVAPVDMSCRERSGGAFKEICGF